MEGVGILTNACCMIPVEKDVGILYLVYFAAIWCSLWPFGIFYGYLIYFSPF
jgi:hypothetical protein